MLSFILTVALATPCLAPPKAPAHHKHHRAHIVTPLQSCVVSLPAMCFREPAPDPEPIPVPTVVTRYVLSDNGTGAPVVYTDAPITTPAGDEWWTYAGGGYYAQPAPPPHIVPRIPPHRPSDPPPHQTPEMDAGTGLSACLLLGGLLAVMRGRRPK